MRDVKPAKILVCKTIPCSIDLEAESTEVLWAEHNKLAELFKEKLKNIEFDSLQALDLKKQSFLDLKLSWR